MTPDRPISFRLLTVAAAIAVVSAVLLALGSGRSRADTINHLSSQLSHEHSRQQGLSASLGTLSHLISSLDAQISLVQSREAAVRADLARDRAELAKTEGELSRERSRIAELKRRLAHARLILSRQLVSSYEGDRPDLVSVVLEARGFNELLEQLDFLHRAEQQQQSLIGATRVAKAQADSAERRLTKLEAADREIAQAAATRVSALAGMNELLQSKQAALGRARAAQQAALDASRAKGRQLQSAISKLRAAQAAAAAAAARAAAPPAVPTATGPALGPSGGWAIPYAIVLCESGGQNLSPNSAGASGYYQILPSTWKLFGGAGPAAYLAGKAEQDAVASRIWNGGAGASNWVCAGLVGIH
jgi:peptidoglycan hydrolase CwlO-like protein